jgi:hypothetical protein
MPELRSGGGDVEKPHNVPRRKGDGISLEMEHGKNAVLIGVGYRIRTHSNKAFV